MIAFIIIIFIILLAWAIGEVNKSTKEHVLNREVNNVSWDEFFKFTYAGGWEELAEIRELQCIIREGFLFITTENKIIESSSYQRKTLSIPFEDIKKLDIKMESEIKNTSIGRILLLGIFSLANRKVNKQFLTIEYSDRNKKDQYLVMCTEGNFQEFLDNYKKAKMFCVKK